MRALLLACLALSGCSSLRAPELTWQALHLVDTVQTLKIARNPDRFHERDAAWLIGAHPSERSVLLWSVGTSVLHYQCARWLDRRNPRAARIFEYGSIAWKARTVGMNFRIGL